MTTNFRRIEYPTKPQREYAECCPDCGGGMDFDTIPCPDGNLRCAVLHYGWICSGCGAMWSRVASVADVIGVIDEVQE